MKHKGVTINITLSVLVLFLVIMTVTSIGNVRIPIEEFIRILLSKVPFVRDIVDTGAIEKSHATIILNLRLPRIILSMFAGFGLAYAGVIYQGVFRNPMAEPYLLGVSSGAALGATIASILPIKLWFFGFSYVSILPLQVQSAYCI